MNNKTARVWYYLFFSVLTILTTDTIFASANQQASALIERLQNSSLSFTENKGQFPDHILYRAAVPNATIWVTRTGMQYQLTRMVSSDIDPAFADSPLPDAMKPKSPVFEHSVIATRLIGANPKSYATGQGIIEEKTNYFLGNDQSKWVTNAPTYSSVAIYNVYPGTDLYYYGSDGKIEYDFSLAPGADPSLIQIEYEGIKSLAIAENGDLLIETEWSTITQYKPVVYQEQNGVRIPLDAEYALTEPTTVGFKLPDNYNPALALVIDPVVTYGTYFGGSDIDVGWDVDVDDCGNAYLVGYTYSTDFPTTDSAYLDVAQGNKDAFVAKFSTKDTGDFGGASLLWSTYVGGSDNDATIYIFIEVDDNGYSYVSSSTLSSDFPVVSGSFDSTFGGNTDVYVFKLSPDGEDLTYSTFIGGGGSEQVYGMTIDDIGHAYVCGYLGFQGGDSTNFYPYKKGFENNGALTVYNLDCFLTKLGEDGDSLIYSTLFGGSTWDFFYSSPSVNADEVVAVAGLSNSTDYDLLNEYEDTYAGSIDAIVAIFDTKDSFSSSLVYSTFLGGSNQDIGKGIAFDSNDNLIVTGYTQSSNFPTVNAYQSTFGGGTADVFLCKLDPTAGTSGLIYSTYVGGSGTEDVYDLKLDSLDQPVFVGRTDGTGWPAVNAIDGTYNGGGRDITIGHFYDGDSIIFSSYLGGAGYDAGYGVAIDKGQSFYIAAKSTGDSLFYGSVLSHDKSINGDTDAVLIKIAPGNNGCQPGDVNDDGTVDHHDEVYLVNYLYFSGPAPHSTSGRINNCSATINIQDIVALVQYFAVCTPIGCSSCP